MAKAKDKAYQMYLTALDMEKTGEDFYEKTGKSAKRAKNEVGEKLFQMLADDEKVHMKRIHTIYAALKKGSKFPRQWKKMGIKHPDIMKVFQKLAENNKGRVKPSSTDLDAIDVGIGLENLSINYYQDRLERSQVDIERDFLAQMVVEEKTHLRLLSDMKLYMTNPESWYVEHEKHGLDGA
jgi:rubrerythrin